MPSTIHKATGNPITTHEALALLNRSYNDDRKPSKDYIWSLGDLSLYFVMRHIYDVSDIGVIAKLPQAQIILEAIKDGHQLYKIIEYNPNLGHEACKSHWNRIFDSYSFKQFKRFWDQDPVYPSSKTSFDDIIKMCKERDEKECEVALAKMSASMKKCTSGHKETKIVEINSVRPKNRVTNYSSFSGMGMGFGSGSSRFPSRPASILQKPKNRMKSIAQLRKPVHGGSAAFARPMAPPKNQSRLIPPKPAGTPMPLHFPQVPARTFTPFVAMRIPKSKNASTSKPVSKSDSKPAESAGSSQSSPQRNILAAFPNGRAALPGRGTKRPASSMSPETYNNRNKVAAKSSGPVSDIPRKVSAASPSKKPLVRARQTFNTSAIGRAALPRHDAKRPQSQGLSNADNDCTTHLPKLADLSPRSNWHVVRVISKKLELSSSNISAEDQNSASLLKSSQTLKTPTPQTPTRRPVHGLMSDGCAALPGHKPCPTPTKPSALMPSRRSSVTNIDSDFSDASFGVDSLCNSLHSAASSVCGSQSSPKFICRSCPVGLFNTNAQRRMGMPCKEAMRLWCNGRGAGYTNIL